MEVGGGKGFQFVRDSSPVLQDSGKLAKQKLKFGMEEILGRTSETKPAVPAPSPLPPVKAYLKRSPANLLQVPKIDFLQVPKVEPRVSPLHPSSSELTVFTERESDSKCDSSFRCQTDFIGPWGISQISGGLKVRKDGWLIKRRRWIC